MQTCRAKFTSQQSVMEICKTAGFSLKDRTMDNTIQLAAKAAIFTLQWKGLKWPEAAVLK